jgi:hypothetical protein
LEDRSPLPSEIKTAGYWTNLSDSCVQFCGTLAPFTFSAQKNIPQDVDSMTLHSTYCQRQEMSDGNAA